MAHKRCIVFVCLIGLILAAPLAVPYRLGSAQGLPAWSALTASISAETVMAHIEALAVEIGPRPMGTPSEELAARYIADQFWAWGYRPAILSFRTVPPELSCEADAALVTSYNVVVTKPGSADSGEIVVIGAHMDSVEIGTGAGDNASGVAAMLAAAEALANVDLARTVIFVAFGANEGGCPCGADVFLQTLGNEVGNVVAMVNVDNVGISSQLNAYAGAQVIWGAAEDEAPLSFERGPGWVRDLAFELADEIGIDLGSTSAETWDGHIGDWGDHIGFVDAGIPVLYLEAWQWTGDSVKDPWWGAETAEGDISHTGNDLVERIDANTVEAAAELVAVITAALGSGSGPLP